jgi:hypothetical protein
MPSRPLQGHVRGSSRGGAAAHGSAPAKAAAAAVVAAAGGAGSSSNARLPCQICQVVIQRHILVCSACGVAFHLDCLAGRWSSTEAARSGGGEGGDRFGGVPEQGHCAACGAAHSWMAMLRGMQTVGWGNKPRGRRGCVLKFRWVQTPARQHHHTRTAGREGKFRGWVAAATRRLRVQGGYPECAPSSVAGGKGGKGTRRRWEARRLQTVASCPACRRPTWIKAADPHGSRPQTHMAQGRRPTCRPLLSTVCQLA